MDVLFDVSIGRGNRKTGPIPTTSRPMGTCPSECPFLPTGAIGGCYGTGRIFYQAEKRASVMTVADAIREINDTAPRSAKYLRDRVVGDVIGENGGLDRDYIAAISAVGRGTDLTVFGYTHAWKRFTPEDVAFIRAEGYVMNASTETEAGVRQAIDLGMPVVMVNADLADGTMVAGRRLITCPAELREDVKCATCGLCAKPDREVIVRFTPHGTVVKRAHAALAAARAEELDEEEAVA